MYYEAFKIGDRHYWRCKTDSGQVVAVSARGYTTRAAALKASRQMWSLNQSFFYKVRES